MTVRRRFLWRATEGDTLVTVESPDGRRFSVGGIPGVATVDAVALPDGRVSVIFSSGRQLTGRALESDGRVALWIGGRRVGVELVEPLRALATRPGADAGGPIELRARIPGRVVEVRVAPGDSVVAGATLLVLEAMKMQNEIRAESAGRVASVECSPGQAVEAGSLLVRLDGSPVS